MTLGALALLEGLGVAVAESEREPTAYARWSAWQRRFLADTSRQRVVRAANQVGKTWAIVHDIVDLVRGTSRFRRRPWAGPINVILISKSLEQPSADGGILEKLWEALPKDEIDPCVRFVRGKGLRGLKYPAIPFVRGPGAGSVIRIRTYEQDPQSLAGATVHAVYADEPVPQGIYDELWPRVLRQRGFFTITFTPTLDMPDQRWLRTLVDDGVFSEHHVPMTPDAAHVEGYVESFLPQDAIDAFARGLPAITRPLRIGASWEAISTDRLLSAFDDRHVRQVRASEIAGAWCGVGIDHGLVPGKQRAVLLALFNRADPERIRGYYLDEVALPDLTTPRQDAEHILAMLKRNGLGYADVDEWIGDRDTGEGRQLKAKNNASLRIQLLHQAGVSSTDDEAKLIATPRKGDGSVLAGAHLMNAMLAEDRLVISPRCVEFIRACKAFKGDSRDPLKDVWDAGRYILERGVQTRELTRIRASYGHRPTRH